MPTESPRAAAGDSLSAGGPRPGDRREQGGFAHSAVRTARTIGAQEGRSATIPKQIRSFAGIFITFFCFHNNLNSYVHKRITPL